MEELDFPAVTGNGFTPLFAASGAGVVPQLGVADFWLDGFLALAPRTDFFEIALFVLRGMLSSINGTHGVR